MLSEELHESDGIVGSPRAYHAIVDEFARAVLISQFWYSYSYQLLRSDSGVSLEKFGNNAVSTLLINCWYCALKHVDPVHIAHGIT